MAGAEQLEQFDAASLSDNKYAQLQAAMLSAAPSLAGAGWAHKYWFLICPDRLDDYHSPRYQRFHLLKLLQMPPDKIGILDLWAPRFNCAGRFISAARQLEVPVTTLNKILNRRDGGIHRYWKVGTTAGDTGTSYWDEMREGNFVSIGWSDTVPDLTQTIGLDPGECGRINRARDFLLANYHDNAGLAMRKAGEILHFAADFEESDLVLACEGQKVLGIGRVRGQYEYDGSLQFPHKRPVEWLLLESLENA